MFAKTNFANTMVRKYEYKTIFWLDYGLKALQWYQDNNIVFVKNCPEVRPIERFSAEMKFRLWKGTETTNSLDKFKKEPKWFKK